MAYRYRSRRSIKKLARKSRRNLIVSLILVAILLYATIKWLLPGLISGLGLLNSILKPPQKLAREEKGVLAPPILNIPFEATATAKINITGFATAKTLVSIYVDGVLKDTVKSLEDGQFEAKDIPLSLGTNEIFAKAQDNSTESLPSKSFKVFYDNEKPPLEIFEPEDGKNIEGGDKKIKVRGKTEPQAKVLVSDTQVVVSSDGTFNMDYPLNEGDNIITIKSKDGAANVTETVRRVIFKP